jgi:hypothetical protein
MITLPNNFVAIRYPGYFWHVVERKLYSIKSGTLRRLKLVGPNRWNKYHSGYQVSHNGAHQWLRYKYLENLTLKNSVIPIED